MFACVREKERQREKGRERASAEGVHGTQIWKSEDNSGMASLSAFMWFQELDSGQQV